MSLQSQVARWDELTTAERDALVAVHVMGWMFLFCPGAPALMSVDSWITCDETGRSMACANWNPTTDHNDCAEAVLALCLSGKQEKSLNMKISRLIGYADGPLFYYLVDPKDVCRAMLEALAGR